ncbi:MAG: PAS domain S-box protein [Myxococcota bacterium]
MDFRALDSLFERAPLGIGWIDEEEVLLFANDALRATFLPGVADPVGKPLAKLLSSARHQRMRRYLLVAAAGDPVSFRDPLEDQLTGRSLQVRLAPASQDGKRVIGLLVADLDADDTAESIEANFGNLIESCQDAVVFIDAESRITFFNQAAQTIFGYSLEEAIGKNVSLLMPAPYAAEHEHYVSHYQETGEAKAIGRIRRVHARRKSGEVFPVELSVSELRINRHVRYGAFIRDVSESVRLQQERVRNERLSAIGLSTSVFAHEVGNPLNNMFLHSQLLERRLRKEAHPLLSKAEAINQEIRRLTRLSGGRNELFVDRLAKQLP